MNSYERIKAMVNHEPVDRVPISGWLHMPIVETNPKDFATASVNFTRDNGWDFCKIMYQAFYFTEDYGNVVEYSKNPLVWNGNIVRWAWNHPMDMLTIKPLDVTKGFLGKYLEATKRICGRLHGEVPVLATVFAPLDVVKDNFGFWSHEIVPKLMEYNPKELEFALESITETELRWIEALRQAGCDGLFYATQMSTTKYLTMEQYREYGLKPSRLLLEQANDLGMWFNLMHIHGNDDLIFRENLDLPIQAVNWEDLLGERRVTLEKARSMTDKILCCGIELFGDFRCDNYNRDAVYARLWERLDTALKAAGGKDRFIFAPGCALTLDVPKYLFTLVQEVVGDYFAEK